MGQGEGSVVGGGQKKEGQKGFGCMKEPQASHLASIKSVILFLGGPQYLKQMDPNAVELFSEKQKLVNKKNHSFF